MVTVLLAGLDGPWTVGAFGTTSVEAEFRRIMGS